MALQWRKWRTNGAQMAFIGVKMALNGLLHRDAVDLELVPGSRLRFAMGVARVDKSAVPGRLVGVGPAVTGALHDAVEVFYVLIHDAGLGG